MNQPKEGEDQEKQFDVVWEDVLDKLEDHNKGVLKSAPKSVCDFIENNVTLLDCPVFCRSGKFETDEYAFIIGDIESNEIIFISYKLYDDIRVTNETGIGFDPRSLAFWLYDEFHVVDNNKFEHHVIFTDGASYVIPFENFYLRRSSWFKD